MRLVIFFAIFCLTVGNEFNKYDEYLVFAAKNHYKSVSQYAADIGFEEFDLLWRKYRNAYRGHEIDQEEEKFHLLKMMQFVKRHNHLFVKGDLTHQVYLSSFSLTYFREYDSLSKPKPNPLSTEYMKLSVDSNKTIVENSSVAIPEAFDWRHFGKVTEVKSQGDCGSCYAFAITSMIESAYLIKFNKSLDLSEQQMLDCDDNEDGCDGGWVGYGLEYAKRVGLEAEQHYPYYENVHRCVIKANDGYKSAHRIADYGALVDASDQQIKQLLLQYGPVVVYINDDGLDFKLYDLGIVSEGEKHLDHVVLIVGWGQGYWIVKNSWGTEWGEQGYVRVATESNVRGINSVVYFVSL